MSKGSRNRQQTQTVIPPWLQEHVSNAFTNVGNATTPLISGGFQPSADTVAGQTAARNFAGATSPFAAMQNRETPWINVQSSYRGAPGSDAYAGMNAATVGDVANVQGRRGIEFANDYMNPYLKDVVDTSLGDYDVGVDRSLGALRAQAAAASPFGGGSRQAVAEGQLLGEAARGRGSLAAGLRSGAFQFGVQSGMADAGRMLQADTANQSTQLSRMLQQATLNQGANQYNAGARQQANMYNQNFAEGQAQFGANQRLAADTTTQTTNAANYLQQQGINLDAAGRLTGDQASRAALLLGSGQAQDQNFWNAINAQLGLLNSAGGFTGQTTTGKFTPGLFDWLSLAANAGATYAGAGR